MSSKTTAQAIGNQQHIAASSAQELRIAEQQLIRERVSMQQDMNSTLHQSEARLDDERGRIRHEAEERDIRLRREAEESLFHERRRLEMLEHNMKLK